MSNNISSVFVDDSSDIHDLNQFRYLPQDCWGIGYSPLGSSQDSELDTSQLFDRTRHTLLSNSTSGAPPFDRNVSISFLGNSVSVYGVLSNNETAFTNITFTINNTQVGTFIHKPNTSMFINTDNLYQYHTLLYENDSLPIGQHNLSIHVPADSNTTSLILDYLTYNTETKNIPGLPSSHMGDNSTGKPSWKASKTSPTPIGPIVGGITAGLAVLALLLLIVFYLRRRQRKTQISIDPYGFQLGVSEHAYSGAHNGVPGQALSSQSGATTMSWHTAPNPFLRASVSVNQSSSTRSDIRSQRTSAISPIKSHRNLNTHHGPSRAALRKEITELKGQMASMREVLAITSKALSSADGSHIDTRI